MTSLAVPNNYNQPLSHYLIPVLLLLYYTFSYRKVEKVDPRISIELISAARLNSVIGTKN